MPDVPKLEDCELVEDLYRRLAMDGSLSDKVKNIYLTYAAVRGSCFCYCAVRLRMRLGT